MPELPEVETMVRGIRHHVTGRTIRKVVQCPNECKPIALTPSFTQLRQRLIGKQFSQVRRLGKRVVLDVSDGSSLVIEPRMTGLVLLADPPDAGHLRLEWQFDDRREFDSLWFWDRRGLGTVTLLSQAELDSRLKTGLLGPDAMEMTQALWKEACAQTRREIKVLLLDQSVVAGIGNLYASEILHLAGIAPTQAAESLKSAEISRLADAVERVLSVAIEYEGSTLGDGTYRNALNKAGRYQNEHRVYMREGETCSICSKAEIVRIIQAQRSTFFCPGCQKMPGRHSKATKRLLADKLTSSTKTSNGKKGDMHASR